MMVRITSVLSLIFLIPSACYGSPSQDWALGRAGRQLLTDIGTENDDVAYTDLAEGDRVLDLPGLGKPEFGLFAGYITVDEAHGRALFYAFAEGVGGPQDKPLILWLNGGPGCSSIGGGFMSELGPYYPNPDGKTLQTNKWSWNQFANVIFLESPAFVGFSYSNTTEDAVVGDQRTADDAYTFLVKFLERFPAYKDTPFYITGESYGGHYVPQLAWRVLEGNKEGVNPKINLKGIAVGNAWTDAAIDNEGAVDFWWTHGLVGDDVADGIKNTCNLSFIGPLFAHKHKPRMSGNGAVGDEDECDAFIWRGLGTFDVVNIYEIYADVCLEARAMRGMKQMAKHLFKGLKSKSDPVPGYDPCIDNEVEKYLNLPEVQKALHAKVGTKWEDCSDYVDYSREDLLSSVLPLWHKLLETDLRFMVYSGDVDGIVPVIGSRRWIAKLGLETLREWTPWMHTDGQVGGFIQFHKGLIFVTVRNAGHMVPYTQPDRAFSVLNWFLNPAKPTSDDALEEWQTLPGVASPSTRTSRPAILPDTWQ